VLTWPLVATLGQASGLRGDYFNNLWNAWWVKALARPRALAVLDRLPVLPRGHLAARHTLSPLNSLTLAGLESCRADVAFNLLLLAHFALSAGASRCSRAAISGSTAGGVLAGWSTASARSTTSISARSTSSASSSCRSACCSS
jgi:hypothetical protein